MVRISECGSICPRLTHRHIARVLLLVARFCGVVAKILTNTCLAVLGGCVGMQDISDIGRY